MAYQVITDFRQGLDARKFKLALPAGTLLKCNNAHITQGGEIEKRKAFVPLTIPAAYVGIHFGLQPVSDGIYIFGSRTFPRAVTGNRQRTANVAAIFVTTRGTRSFAAGDVVNISGIGGAAYNGNGITILTATNSIVTGAPTTQTITYASVGGDEGLTADAGGVMVLQVSTQLPAPLNYLALTNPGSDEPGGYSDGLNALIDMTAVVSSTTFSGEPFAIAAFSDRTVFPFYGGPSTITLLRSGVTQVNAQSALLDSYIGLQLAAFVAVDVFSGQNLLKLLAVDINNNISTYTTNYISGGSNFDVFSVPTTLNGTPYTITSANETAAGTLALAQQNNGIAATAAAQPVGSFQIISADAGTQATGTLVSNVSSATNVTDGDTVTVAAITYRWKNSMAAINDVKRGANRAASMASLAATINGTGVSGTDFFAGTLPNATVRCTGLNNTTGNFALSLAAITGGTAGNAFALSTTAATLVASGANFAGGVDSKVNQIVVNGATNLLTAAVTFTTDEQTTAAAVAAAVNANVISGYSATSDGATVNILKTVAGSAANGFTVQVQAQGTVVCGTGAFSIAGSGFTLDYCKANGVDLLNDASPFIPANSAAVVLTYPLVPSQVLSDFCRVAANSINSGTATHGYLAYCPTGSVSVFLCKATTTSTDKQQILDVSVTPSTGTGTALPGSLTPLTVTLDSSAAVIPLGGKSNPVTATVQGGLAPFKYQWKPADTLTISVLANNPKSAQTTFSFASKSVTGKTVRQAPDNNQAPYVCVVTDALGEQATSVPVYITVLATS